MAAQCLEHMATPGRVSQSEQEFAAPYPFLRRGGAAEGAADGGASADRRLLLQFALRLMLYQPASTKGPSNPLAAAQAAARGPQPMDVDAAAPAAPPGMSAADVAAVEGKAPPAGAYLPCYATPRCCGLHSPRRPRLHALARPGPLLNVT